MALLVGIVVCGRLVTMETVAFSCREDADAGAREALAGEKNTVTTTEPSVPPDRCSQNVFLSSFAVKDSALAVATFTRIDRQHKATHAAGLTPKRRASFGEKKADNMAVNKYTMTHL